MNELKELSVDEISLVDAGANPEAHIVFFKRKQEEKSMAKKETAAEVVKQEEKQEEATLFDNLSKSLEEAIDITAAQKENTELKARITELEKKLAERDVADKAAVEKAAKEKAEADSAEVAALFERLNKRLDEHIEKAEQAEMFKVASKYEILGENATELAAVLKKAKGSELYEKIIGNLDRELAIVEKSGLYDEIGKSGVGSQAVSIEKIAKKIQKDNPTLTWLQAVDKAFQAHPELQD